MVFIRFQYPLQRHFVVLVVAGLVVDITIMQAPIAIHRFMFIPMVLQDLSVGLLQVPNKQWGYSTGGSGAWALKFNGVYTAVVVGAPGFPAREFCGFTFDYTLTGWSFTAGYNSPISYIRPITTAISLGY